MFSFWPKLRSNKKSKYSDVGGYDNNIKMSIRKSEAVNFLFRI